MKFERFYSSSKANLYQVTATNSKRLLIECGVAWSKLQKALKYDLSNIEGCLLTHEHKDHSKAIKEVIRAGIKVFLSKGTYESLRIELVRKVEIIRDRSLIRFGQDFGVLAFNINHDAVEPLGFIIHEITTKEYLLYITDTSHITQRFEIPFSIIAIECSYDKDILQKRVEAGDINEEVAKRLLTSHMEKQTTIRYLAEFCDLSKCREIHLLHMSGDNIDKKETKKDFEDRFFIETRI